MNNVSTVKRNEWLDVRPSMGISLMDHLYNRLDGMYPQRWRANFASPDSIQNWREAWAESFDEEGITPQKVSDGLKACRKLYDWPPSLPEFLKACNPQMDYEAAFHHATDQMFNRHSGKTECWGSKAVFWAAVSLGGDLNQPYQTIKVRWRSALDEQLSKDILPEIPALVTALPAPGQETISKEQAAQNIERIKSMLKVKAVEA